jgi:predicted site-specific integrase-resolvase
MKSLDVLSVADAAKKIGIREKTLRRRINRGSIEVDTLIGKQVLTHKQVAELKAEEIKKRKRS